jgi:uncharacterized coiled-coil protein SlyX
MKPIHVETIGALIDRNTAYQEIIVALQDRVVYQDRQLSKQKKIINELLNKVIDLANALVQGAK